MHRGGPDRVWGTGSQMAGHSAYEERSLRADGQGAQQGDAVTPDRLQAAMRDHLRGGALEHARAAADLFASHKGHSSGLSLLVEAALEMGYLQMARLALADDTGKTPPDEVTLIRARIAQAQGDLVAARAILVAAIEAAPNHAAARRALAEVMVAMGTAADARSVLAHLGAPPGATAAE